RRGIGFGTFTYYSLGAGNNFAVYFIFNVQRRQNETRKNSSHDFTVGLLTPSVFWWKFIRFLFKYRFSSYRKSSYRNMDDYSDGNDWGKRKQRQINWFFLDIVCHRSSDCDCARVRIFRYGNSSLIWMRNLKKTVI